MRFSLMLRDTLWWLCHLLYKQFKENDHVVVIIEVSSLAKGMIVDINATGMIVAAIEESKDFLIF